MAAWQFDLYIVLSDAQPPLVSDEGWEPPPLPMHLVYSFQEELAHYLGPPWQMLNNWLVFGPENGNRIDILFESDEGAFVSVRCDVREEAPQFLVLVADLSRFHGCQFFSPNTREFIEPDLELVLDAIRKSQA
jgi:hypothetical protein